MGDYKELSGSDASVRKMCGALEIVPGDPRGVFSGGHAKN